MAIRRRAAAPAGQGAPVSPAERYDALLPGARGDVDPPSESNAIVAFSPSLILEKADSLNWVLKQRVLVAAGSKNAGRHKWVVLGYYGTPGACAAKVAALRFEEEAGGTVSFADSLAAYARVEAGLAASLEEAARLDEVVRRRPALERAARVATIEEVASLFPAGEDRERVLALLKRG